MTQIIRPTEVRYIKLGRKGAWEKECITGPTKTIRLGFNSPCHQQCLREDWDALTNYWKGEGKSDTEATKIVHQVKDFYTLDEDTIWITFYNRILHWCRAERTIHELPDGSRIRNVFGKWESEDSAGKSLEIESLNGRLTKVQGYRGTICRVHERDYLISRINGEPNNNVKSAEDALKKLKEKVAPIIQELHWKDFELLVDMILTRAGWQRISSRGGTEKDIDMDMLQPVTGRRAFVQVKSSSCLKEFESYTKKYEENKGKYSDMLFISHTTDRDDEELRNHAKKNSVNFLGLNELSSLTVDSGLTQWLINKTS